SAKVGSPESASALHQHHHANRRGQNQTCPHRARPAQRGKRSRRRSLMILIPVKNLANAKQRLASLLDQVTRTELAQAMLFDVLEALATWANRPEVSLVTSDPFA